MQFLRRFYAQLEEHELVLSSLVLALVVILVYGEIVFLGYTLSPAAFSPGVLSSGPYGYDGRRIAQLPLIDAWASGVQELPMNRLVAQYLWSGQVPLWNPYMGAGTPLAADTTISAFSPIRILDLIPYTYDLSVLLRIWLAGVLMVLFLKNLQIGTVPALGGALFYMLSGAFVWSNGMIWINVCMFAPLLMYAVERVIQNRNPSDVPLLSFAVFLSILGAFIETIVLQFILVMLFFLFRAVTLKRFVASLARFTLGFLGGIGLSAFYLFIVFEYLTMSALGNPPTAGVSSLPYWLFGTIFVPYIIGGLGQYWSRSISTGTVLITQLPGYVGVLCLLFSVIATISWIQSRDRSRLLVPFFILTGFIALLKTFGNPTVNWIGQLPVLEFINFAKFLGFFWAFCFAACSAYGLEEVMRGVRREIIVKSLVASLGVVLMGFAVLTPFLFDPSLQQTQVSALAWLPEWMHGISMPRLALFYLIWRTGEASLLLVVGALIADRVARDRSLGGALISLIVLEMSWHIPRALPYSQQMVQSVWMASFVVLLLVLVVFWKPLAFKVPAIHPLRLGAFRVRPRHFVFALLVLSLLIGQVALSSASQYGFPRRYDDFREAPYVTFLKQKAGYFRVYSLDYTLVSSFAGVYGIYDLGIISAFNVYSFDRFARSHIDSQKLTTNLNPEVWRGSSTSPVDELRKNMIFYDLLGVRFIIASSNLTEQLSLPLVYRGEVSVYENPNAYPRAFLVQGFRKASNYTEAQQMLTQSNFDPRSEVTIEDPAGELEPLGEPQGQEPAQSQVQVTRYEPNIVVVDVQTEKPALLVLTDTYYPGWRAEVNGKPTTVYRADGLFRAVRIEPGQHTVTFSYLPDSFFAGIAASIITMVGLAHYYLKLTRRRKHASRFPLFGSYLVRSTDDPQHPGRTQVLQSPFCIGALPPPRRHVVCTLYATGVHSVPPRRPNLPDFLRFLGTGTYRCGGQPDA